VLPVCTLADVGLTVMETGVLSGGVLGTEAGEPVVPAQPAKPSVPASKQSRSPGHAREKLAPAKGRNDCGEDIILDRQGNVRARAQATGRKDGFSTVPQLGPAVNAKLITYEKGPVLRSERGRVSYPLVSLIRSENR
jgi:hypothetical protein